MGRGVELHRFASRICSLFAHFGPIGVENLLHLICFGRHLPQQFGINLLAEVGQIEHLDLTTDHGILQIALLADLLEPGERRRIGERLVEGVLSILLGLEILLGTGHVGLPPTAGGADFKFLCSLQMVFDEGGRRGLAGIPV